MRGAEEALCFPEQPGRLTFSGWYGQATALASALSARGLGPGSHIALIAENRLEWPVVQMAAALLGAIFIPLNTHYRREDLKSVLAHARAEAVLTVPSYRGNPYLENIEAERPRLPHLREIITIGEAAGGHATFDDLVSEGSNQKAPHTAPDPDTVAALLFTSGTTGVPKGALLTHRSMMMNARATAERLQLQPGERWTSIIPLFHCAGCIMSLLGCLQRGAAYVGVPSFTPTGMFEVIEKEKCTLLSGVPTSFLAMLEHPERGNYDLSSLRSGTCGGADCNADVLRACAEEYPVPELTQVYGQTESSTLIAAAACNDPQRFETCGEPLPGFEVRIADPVSGDAVAQGEVGEILGRGPMVMQGYFDMADVTAETLDGDGWLHTGDLGYLNASGRLVISGGRLRDMIIRGGENIYPVEIENLLQEHPSIEQIAVFGLADDYYGERVAAAIIATTPVTAASLRDYCAERIARFKVPAEFYLADAFPLTSSGKVRKTELRALVAAGELRQLS